MKVALLIGLFTLLEGLVEAEHENSSIFDETNSSDTKEIQYKDVIIIGAGAAGAGAARDFKRWNTKNPQDTIDYIVLESQNRLGGRIMDIELGKQYENEKRTSGGFDNNGSKVNIGCHCKEVDEPCTNFKVEVGAGWFTGDRGITTRCKVTPSPTPNPTTPRPTNSSPTSKKSKNKTKTKDSKDSNSKKTKGSNSKVSSSKRKKSNAFPESSIDSRESISKNSGDSTVGSKPSEIIDRQNLSARRERDVANIEHKEKWKRENNHGYGPNKKLPKCPKNINRMYALSQNQGSRARNTNPPLAVNCDYYDGQDTSDNRHKFLEYSSYYGLDEMGKPHMEPVDTKAMYLPGFDFRSGKKKKVKARNFLNRFWNSIQNCVDPVNWEFFYQWASWKRYDYPFWYNLNSTNITWEELDLGFDVIPEKVNFPDAEIKQNFCSNYSAMVQDFATGNTKSKKDARKLLNFYKNFAFFSEYLNRNMSMMNFGAADGAEWGWDVNYSIDQRGLKEVVKNIMPWDAVRYNTHVESIDYSGDIVNNGCNDAYPVKVVTSASTLCTKKVLSTLSIGVMEHDARNDEGLFKPKIDMSKSPFEMGNLVKVYFRFPKKFWGDKEIGREDDTDEEYLTFPMLESFRHNLTDRTVRGEYFYNLDHFFKNEPSVQDTKSLFMFMSTPDLDLIGVDDPNISDEIIAEKVWHLLDPLRVKYGEQYVEPNCWYFKNWNDKLHRGAYGIQKHAKTYFDHYDFFKPRVLLAKKSEKVLYLSGEASCFNHWGFIEGAYEAGSRDARMIIRNLMGSKAYKVSTFSACFLRRTWDHCWT